MLATADRGKEGQVTRVAATFVAADPAGRESQTVTSTVARLVFDTLSVMLCGEDEDLPRRVLGSFPSVRVGERPTVAERALVLGAMAHIHDFDDYLALAGHPSSILVSVLAASFEQQTYTTPDLVAAYVSGLEVWARIAASSRHHYEAGFHTTATVGAMGAAAAAGRLAGFTATEISNSWGVAASLASGLRGAFGTDMKAYQVGHAAATGVRAIELTRVGVAGPLDTFDSDSGYLAALFDSESRESARRSLAQLSSVDSGRLAAAVSPPLAKPYPSCGGSFGAIDAALELRKSIPGQDLMAIRRIIAVVPPYFENALRYRLARTGLEGKFSLEYCIASTLMFGRPGLSSFTDTAAADPRVRTLSAAVERKYDPAMDALAMRNLMPATLECHINGAVVTSRVVRQTGNPESPLNKYQLMEKARTNVPTRRAGVLRKLEAALALDDVAGMFAAMSWS